MATGILPTPKTPLSSLPVGSKSLEVILVLTERPFYCMYLTRIAETRATMPAATERRELKLMWETIAAPPGVLSF